jgi:hypothetical protein
VFEETSVATRRKAHDIDVPQQPQNLHFYLLRPNALGKFKCLVPTLPTATLMEVIRNKTLVEFPTFYVREEAPDDLPAPFIAEEKYNELYGSEVPIEIPTDLPADRPEEVHDPISLPDNIDEKLVLEVLQKDLIR